MILKTMGCDIAFDRVTKVMALSQMDNLYIKLVGKVDGDSVEYSTRTIATFNRVDFDRRVAFRSVVWGFITGDDTDTVAAASIRVAANNSYNDSTRCDVTVNELASIVKFTRQALREMQQFDMLREKLNDGNIIVSAT